MTPNYSQTAVNDRLQGVVTAIDDSGAGFIRLLAGGVVVSSIALQNPCGTVSGGVLTFTGTLVDPSAANTGVVTGARIEDGAGNIMVSGLTVGIPLSGADILLTNGLNTTLITAGQAVSVVSGQIIGS
jgi:hypothetical protein